MMKLGDSTQTGTRTCSVIDHVQKRETGKQSLFFVLLYFIFI